MITFSWKKLLGPAIAGCTAVYIEEMEKKRVAVSKTLILLAKKNNYEEFERIILTLDHNANVDNIWKIAMGAVGEVEGGLASTKYVISLKGVVDKLTKFKVENLM